MAFSALVCFAHGAETTICRPGLAPHGYASINLPSGSTALARHIGTALALPCPAWLSPCPSFLSSFLSRSLTATQNTPPCKQADLFRSQTGHTVSLLVCFTVIMFHCYTASLLL